MTMLLRVVNKLSRILGRLPDIDDHETAVPYLNAVFEHVMHANRGLRANYTWGMVQSAFLASALDVERISALEFGVAGGNGLLALERAAKRLAEIMGVQLTESLPYRAVVHCAAKRYQRLQQVPYQGEPTCASANLVAGIQGCTYGCLGLGDCTRACQYDAIHTVDGLATVDYQKCIGCKACARTCPRNIITMVPFKAERMLVVACSNQDKGPDVKEVCEIGCIGCTGCSRNAELMQMQGNLPMVDYDHYGDDADFSKALKKCPREGMLYVGKPTEEDLAAVAAEELPERVEADFKTTVDDTEWRG